MLVALRDPGWRRQRPLAPTGSLEELLEETKTARARQAQANAAREHEFVAKRDQQAALLAEAKRERDAAAARSQSLSSQFDANEVKLTELSELRDASGWAPSGSSSAWCARPPRTSRAWCTTR